MNNKKIKIKKKVNAVLSSSLLPFSPNTEGPTDERRHSETHLGCQ
jgi:hypothetical protein